MYSQLKTKITKKGNNFDKYVSFLNLRGDNRYHRTYRAYKR